MTIAIAAPEDEPPEPPKRPVPVATHQQAHERAHLVVELVDAFLRVPEGRRRAYLRKVDELSRRYAGA